MAETKHTPGPWEIAKPNHPDPRQIEDRLIFTTVKGERLHVAEVYQYQNDNNREANGTALANSDLIAAAPELLESIQNLLDQFKKWEGYHQWDEKDEIAVDGAQSAIAKARPDES